MSSYEFSSHAIQPAPAIHYSSPANPTWLTEAVNYKDDTAKSKLADNLDLNAAYSFSIQESDQVIKEQMASADRSKPNVNFNTTNSLFLIDNNNNDAVSQQTYNRYIQSGNLEANTFYTSSCWDSTKATAEIVPLINFSTNCDFTELKF